MDIQIYYLLTIVIVYMAFRHLVLSFQWLSFLRHKKQIDFFENYIKILYGLYEADFKHWTLLCILQN